MKILFLSEGVSLAHIGRPLTLAKWAFEAGHTIHFACCKEGFSKIGTYPEYFKIHYLNQTIKSSTFYTRVKKGKFFYTFEEMIRYVDEEINLYRIVKPDLIVTDFRLTAPISSKICNLPLLNLSNSHWSPHRDCPFPAPDNSFLGNFPAWLKNGLFSLIRPMTFKLFALELNRIRKHYGLEPKNDFRQLYTDGDYNAYLDLPEFSEIKNIPENHFFLGPVLWNANGPEFPHKIEKGIYISMGSTGNNELIDRILIAVMKTKAFVILSGISDSEKTELLRKYPDLRNRSWIHQLVDPNRILDQCNLTICHGGSGTVYQSLAHGTPVLCFPSNPDQSLVSMALVEKNLGCYLSPKNATKSNIQAAIDDCLSNEILKKNVDNYAQKIKQWDTLKHWNLFLNQFNTTRKSIKDIA